MMPASTRALRGTLARSWPARVLVAVCYAAITLGLGTTAVAPAWAQARTPVVGTADFRNPPTLASGQYTDTIVTGDTVWYAVIYRNDMPYRFEVSLGDVDVDADDELTLVTSFVGPSLETIATSESELSGNGAAYLGGHTNVWYVTVMLETTGTAGVQHRLLLDVEGVESTGLEDCFRLPGCTFDAELDALDERLAEIEADLAIVSEPDPIGIVQRDIDSLRGSLESAETLLPAAEARLARAEARIAAMCAPAATCETFPDPGSKTSLLGWLIGLAALGGGVARAATKSQGSKPKKKKKEPPAPGRRPNITPLSR